MILIYVKYYLIAGLIPTAFTTRLKSNVLCVSDENRNTFVLTIETQLLVDASPDTSYDEKPQSVLLYVNGSIVISVVNGPVS